MDKTTGKTKKLKWKKTLIGKGKEGSKISLSPYSHYEMLNIKTQSGPSTATLHTPASKISELTTSEQNEYNLISDQYNSPVLKQGSLKAPKINNNQYMLI